MPVATRLLDALNPVVPPVCFECGASASGSGPLCRACRAALAWLPPVRVMLAAGAGHAVEAWAPLAYRGGARALARALKFRGAVSLADTMAAQIAASAPPRLFEVDALVPVPLHRTRRRRRGFNQAEVLARALARRARVPVDDCLDRGGGRGTQMGRDRDQRLRALEGAIALRPGKSPPRSVLLVDDVITTGATVLACAHVLVSAGAERVGVVAYTRTPGR